MHRATLSALLAPFRHPAHRARPHESPVTDTSPAVVVEVVAPGDRGAGRERVAGEPHSGIAVLDWRETRLVDGVFVAAIHSASYLTIAAPPRWIVGAVEREAASTRTTTTCVRADQSASGNPPARRPRRRSSMRTAERDPSVGVLQPWSQPGADAPWPRHQQSPLGTSLAGRRAVPRDAQSPLDSPSPV